jgi:hypothetical protein
VEAGWAAAGRKRAHGKKAVGLEASRAEKKDWAGCGERGGQREKVFFLFLLNSFQIRFSNFQTQSKQKSMHSNHDAQTLFISKLF